MRNIYRIALAIVISMTIGVASLYAAALPAAKAPAVNEKAVAAAINALKPANSKNKLSNWKLQTMQNQW